MTTRKEFILGLLFRAIVLMFLYPLLIKWIWNGVVSTTFGIAMITYWQAFGLFWLFGFLNPDQTYYHFKRISEKLGDE